MFRPVEYNRRGALCCLGARANDIEAAISQVGCSATGQTFGFRRIQNFDFYTDAFGSPDVWRGGSVRLRSTAREKSER
jgi:hypothetical protein